MPRPPPKRSWPIIKIKDHVAGWLLVLPSAVFIGVFTLWPLVQVGVASLFRNDLATPEPRFAGFGQYQALASDPVFLKVLVNTFWYSLETIVLGLLGGLGLALLAHHGLRQLKPLVRLAWFFPTFVPMVAAANLWLYLYTPGYGLVDAFLGLVHLPPTPWLGQPSTVMPALVVMYVWKQAGYFMIFFLAGLQAVDLEYYEAARIEGARGPVVFWRITLPLLMPTALFVFVIATTSAFKTVDHLILMTQGGPDNASAILLFLIYQTAFQFWDLGKASAMTVCLLVVLLGFIVVNLRSFDRKIHYQGDR